MSTLRAVAFDLGGVLVDVDHARAAGAIGRSLADWELALFSSDAHERVSRGLASPAALFDPAAHALGCSANDVEHAWAQVVRVWEGAEALVHAVERRGLRVLVWSNTDPVHAQEMARALPVIAGARGLSFRVGEMKPVAAFYERALETDLRFDEVLFLDDRQENVEAALRLGVVARTIVGGLTGTRAALEEFLGDGRDVHPPASHE
jgi:HAD superfamily hydrolase (TIGR01509 family)